MYVGPHVKYLFFCQILKKLQFFSTDFFKNIQIPNFKKIVPLAAELLYADGRMDRHDKTIVVQITN